MNSMDDVRSLMRRGGRIAFPPALGEPDLVADLPAMLGDATAEIVMPYRTRRASLTFGPKVTLRALFGGRNVDGLDYAPVPYGRLPELIKPGGPLQVDIALVRLTPPSATGLHNVGPSATMTTELIRSARYVVAEIDPDLPWTEGDTVIPGSLLTLKVDAKEPLELPADDSTTEVADVKLRVAGNAASLVPDGSYLEVGVGSTAQAVVEGFRAHRDLRLHIGMLSASLKALLESDAVDPAWITPVGEAIGPASLMRFIDRNPRLKFSSARDLHDPLQLVRYDRFISVNSVLAVDLLGRAACEGEFHRPIGGLGGLTDFLLGGRLSREGQNILVLPSVTRAGASRVVSRLPSEEVSIPNFLVDFVVTEWGIASLRGATRRECAERLVGVAHPDKRVGLEEAFANKKRRTA
jgi:acetyl-CoA hydrolase